MSAFGFQATGTGLSSISAFVSRPPEMLQTPSSSTTRVERSVQQIVRESMTPSTVDGSGSTPKPVSVKPPTTEADVEHVLESTIAEIQDINANMQSVQNDTDGCTTNQTVIYIVQQWVTEFILQGALSTTEAVLPWIAGSAEALEGFHPVSQEVAATSDVVEAGTGLVTLFNQWRALRAASQQLEQIRAKYDQLTPEQQGRFSQLERLIQHEKHDLSMQKVEQGMVSARAALSYTTFSLADTLSETAESGAPVLTTGSEALIGGLNVGLQGMLFYRAHKNFKVHDTWSKSFEGWIQKTTPSVTLDAPHLSEEQRSIRRLEAAEKIQKLVEKRVSRQKDQIQSLKDKLAKGEISKEAIQNRVEKFKASGLQSFMSHLHPEKMSLDTFHVKLEEKLGMKVDPQLAQSIHESYKRLNEIKNLPSPQKEQQAKEIKAKLSQDIKQCAHLWTSHQSEETLLSQYVDYQAVMNTTIKSSLSQMVKKKHQIEQKFLKFSRGQMGLKFGLASIIFGISLTLGIIALVSNPIGAAALVLLILSKVSMATSIGSLGAGYYYAHRQKPALTAATLKGAYLRLYYYRARASIRSLRESIGNYLSTAWKRKTDQLITTFSRHFSLFGKADAVRHATQPPKTIDGTPAEISVEKAKSQAQQWKEKANQLQENLNQLAWADFARQANLKIGQSDSLDMSSPQAFDTLNAFNEALSQCDLSLLSDENRELLEKQLGINVHSLQDKIDKDPNAVKEILRNFFNLEGFYYMKLISQQAFLNK